MSKIFVFGIGGTGSRVIKALTMLLASGVKCDSVIVPIIIDPDAAAADLTRTVGYLDLYEKLRTADKAPDDRKFFGTQISKPNPNIAHNYRLSLYNNTQNKKFEEFIGLTTMTKNNRAICEALFSGKNLKSNMKVGFKGNPNIGSVVLNQFGESEILTKMGFDNGDRIFIISSIFGGTGASGFPLLLKTLRSVKTGAGIENCPIGAISVHPYFNVKTSKESEIDSSTFISKTKSALQYYNRNISEAGNQLDAFYYIGDTLNAEYENIEGGNKQKNNAHIIELAAALAVLDFDKNCTTHDGNTQHKEFGVANDKNEMTFVDLATETYNLIQRNMTQMHLMAKYIETTLEDQMAYQPWAIDRKINSAFVKGEFFKNLKTFTNEYELWIKEMAETKRAFKPFNLEGRGDIFDSINGKDAKSSRFSSYAVIDDLLNGIAITDKPAEEQFLKIFYDATTEALNKKIDPNF